MWDALRASHISASKKPLSSILVQYSKDSPNAFRRRRRRGIPPAKIRKGGGAAPLTISSFSLAATKINLIGTQNSVNFPIIYASVTPKDKFTTMSNFSKTIFPRSFRQKFFLLRSKFRDTSRLAFVIVATFFSYIRSGQHAIIPSPLTTQRFAFLFRANFCSLWLWRVSSAKDFYVVIFRFASRNSVISSCYATHFNGIPFSYIKSALNWIDTWSFTRMINNFYFRTAKNTPLLFHAQISRSINLNILSYIFDNRAFFGNNSTSNKYRLIQLNRRGKEIINSKGNYHECQY